jgi:CubicO group peptidase (beta-lactamase class C family)
MELDAPVKRYLPRFDLPDAKLAESITIRDLLCHRWGVDSDSITFAEAYSGLINDEMFYAQLKNAKIKGSFQYTNLHYTILGRVVEKVTGLPWKDVLAKRIFEPAGMTRATAYASRMYGSDDVAQPYTYVLDANERLVPAPLRKTDRTMHAAGGMGASGNDVARWLLLNVNSGATPEGARILSDASVQQMRTLLCEQRSTRKILWQRVRLGYGLGWEISEYRGHKMVGHNGGYVGAAAHISFLPDEQIGVAVFANTDGPGAWVDVIAAQVYDRLLEVKDAEDALAKFEQTIANADAKRPPPHVLTGKNPVAATDGLSQPPAKYAGAYVHPELGELRVTVENNQLAVSLGEIRPQLLSDGTDRFKPNVPGAMLRSGSFEVTPDGKVIAVRITLEDGEARFVRR